MWRGIPGPVPTEPSVPARTLAYAQSLGDSEAAEARARGARKKSSPNKPQRGALPGGCNRSVTLRSRNLLNSTHMRR